MHTIHSESRNRQFGWDNAVPPILEIEPGDVVSLDVQDGGGGQVTPSSRSEDIPSLDFSRVNPVTGPIFVKGAEVGDALEVALLEFRPKNWGWTAIIPGFGLLSDQFQKPFLKIWEIGPGASSLAFSEHIRIPMRPFPGTIGVALDEAGTHSVVPPRKNGGNMDIRHLTAGTRLLLPVWVKGALLSIGDLHAAQGDGEVCGTAIEAPMEIVVRVNLVKGARLKTPEYITQGPLAEDATGAYVTTGIGPDAFQDARDACIHMIDHLTDRHGLTPEEAYCLISVAGDLRISEIVDQPNWVVSCVMPLSIFR